MPKVDLTAIASRTRAYREVMALGAAALHPGGARGAQADAGRLERMRKAVAVYVTRSLAPQVVASKAGETAPPFPREIARRRLQAVVPALLDKLDGPQARQRRRGLWAPLRLAETGQRHEAEALLHQELARHPQEPRALLLLAELQLQSGHCAQAILTATQAMADPASGGAARLVLARAQLLAGHPDAARAALAAAEQLHADPAGCAMARAMIEHSRGDPRATLGALCVAMNEVAAKGFANASAMAEVFGWLADPEGVLTWLEISAHHAPQDAFVLRALQSPFHAHLGGALGLQALAAQLAEAVAPAGTGP